MKYNPYSLFVGSAALILWFGQAYPLTSYTVDTPNDNGIGSGGVSTSATSGDLRFVLNKIMNDQITAGADTRDISFSGVSSITLQGILPMINLVEADTTTINSSGSTVTINGGGSYRGFFIKSGIVNINNITFANTVAQGGLGGSAGNGGGPGGGGAGLGGAIFVDDATVTLTNVAMNNCSAIGANGGGQGTGTTGGGGAGGGGIGGAGGSSNVGGSTLNGGGGGGGYSGNGGNAGATADSLPTATTVGSGGGGGFGSVNALYQIVTGGAFQGGSGGGGAIIGATGGAGGFNSSPGADGGTVSNSNVSGGTFVMGGGGGGGGEANGFVYSDPGTGGGIGAGAAGPTGGGGGSGGSGGTAASNGIGGSGVTGGGGGGGGVLNGMDNSGGDGGLGSGGGGAGPVFVLPGSNGGSGGYGGGGGGGVVAGSGSFGGGGGGVTGDFGGFSTLGTTATAGSGGFGGGGGGTCAFSLVASGDGGFGGGGGGGSITDGTTPGTPGAGGVGGGPGAAGSISSAGFGGSGAGLGGAIFVNTGTVIFGDGVSTGSGGSANGVAGGTSNTVAAAAGIDIFAVSGATLTFSPSTTVTINNSIADDSENSLPGGSGAYTPGTGDGVVVNMSGTGTLVLNSVANSYAGGTNITSGILNATGTTGTVLGTGDVTIGASGTLQAGGNLTLSNVMSVTSGGVVDANSFGVTLSGPITGSLSITDSSGSNTGVVTLSNASNGYTEASLDGGSTLLIETVGAFPLEADLSIDSATFEMNDIDTTIGTVSGSSGSVITGTSSSSTLTIESSSGSFDADISGAGILSKTLAGTLTLGGTNTYTGGTTISAGTLSLNTSSAFPSNSVLTFAAGLLNMNDNDIVMSTLNGAAGVINTGSSSSTTLTVSNGTFTGFFSGSGSLVKTSSGSFIYGGSSCILSAGIAVNAGLFSANGTITNDISVASGATLGGIGTINGSVLVQGGGTISPGNSIGTITVGTLALASSAITEIELNPTSSSKIVVTSSASLAGNVHVVQDAGIYPKEGTYTILQAPSAGAISGSYNPTVLGAMAGFNFSIVQNGNLIQLVYGGFQPIINTSGLNGNNLTLANYLNGSPNLISHDLQVLTLLNQDELNQALLSLSPARNANNVFVSQNVAFSLSEVVSSHMTDERFFQFAKHEVIGLEKERKKIMSYMADSNDIPSLNQGKEDSYTFWLGVFGDFAKENKTSQNYGFNFDSEGVFVGFDYFVKDRGLVGTGIGYARSHLDDEQNAGHADANYYVGSAYATGYFSDFYLETVLWGLFHSIDNTRNISYSTVNATAQTNIYGWQLTPHLGFGYTIERNWVGIEPFAAFDWAVNWERKYDEQGADILNMRQKSHASSMLRSEVGFRFFQSKIWDTGSLVFREKVGYVNKKPFGTGSVTAAIFGDPNFFTVDIFKTSENLVSVGFDFVVQTGKKLPLISLTYGGEFGPSYTSNEVMFKLSQGF